MSGSEGISLLHESGSNAGGGGASSSSSSHRRAGINRIKWSADGRRIAVASGDKVHVLSVSEEFCKGKGDEEGRVMHNLISRGQEPFIIAGRVQLGRILSFRCKTLCVFWTPNIYL